MQVFNALNGFELKQLALKKVQEKLDGDHHFRHHCAYPQVRMGIHLVFEVYPSAQTRIELDIEENIITIDAGTGQPVAVAEPDVIDYTVFEEVETESGRAAEEVRQTEGLQRDPSGETVGVGAVEADRRPGGRDAGQPVGRQSEVATGMKQLQERLEKLSEREPSGEGEPEVDRSMSEGLKRAMLQKQAETARKAAREVPQPVASSEASPGEVRAVPELGPAFQEVQRRRRELEAEEGLK